LHAYICVEKRMIHFRTPAPLSSCVTYYNFAWFPNLLCCYIVLWCC